MFVLSTIYPLSSQKYFQPIEAPKSETAMGIYIEALFGVESKDMGRGSRRIAIATPPTASRGGRGSIIGEHLPRRIRFAVCAWLSPETLAQTAKRAAGLNFMS